MWTPEELSAIEERLGEWALRTLPGCRTARIHSRSMPTREAAVVEVEAPTGRFFVKKNSSSERFRREVDALVTWARRGDGTAEAPTVEPAWPRSWTATGLPPPSSALCPLVSQRVRGALGGLSDRLARGDKAAQRLAAAGVLQELQDNLHWLTRQAT